MPPVLAQLFSDLRKRAIFSGSRRSRSRRPRVASRHALVLWCSAAAGCVLLIAFLVAGPLRESPGTLGAIQNEPLQFVDIEALTPLKVTNVELLPAPQEGPELLSETPGVDAQPAAPYTNAVYVHTGPSSAAPVHSAIFRREADETAAGVWLTGGIEDAPDSVEQYPHARR